jgi:hypothetical protein
MYIGDFRELYEELVDYDGEREYQDVLLPWQDRASRAMDVLKIYGDHQARHFPEENIYEHLWDLYALSRISDVLLLPFQQGSYDSSTWPGPNIKPEEREAFFLALGMRPIEQQTFHPFFHEIVEVKQSPDPQEPISLEAELWSGFMLKNLLICRAGVRVRGGSKLIDKETAERSTLYFAFRRKNRPASDLSHGWGSNSQWRTSFRRDYEDDTAFFYNVDGKVDATLAPEKRHPTQYYGLTPEESLELVVNRCFIVTKKLGLDPFPFNDTYVERKSIPDKN